MLEKAQPLIKVLHDFKPTHAGLFLSRSLHAYVSLLACALSGVAYMPINEATEVEQLHYILSLTKTHHIITDRKNSALLQKLLLNSELKYTIIVIDQLVPITGFVFPKPLKNSNAYIMFTSGSTGKPKAVAVGQSQLLHYLRVSQQRFKPNEKDLFSQIIELTFDLSVHDIFLCWSVGARLCVFTGQTYPELGQYFEQKALSFCLMVPSTAVALDRYKQLFEKRFHSLRTILFCGEPLPHLIAQKMQQAAPLSHIENIYGPTEATIAFTGYVWKKQAHEKTHGVVSIGKAFEGLRTQVLNREGNECAIGEVGELWLGGPQVVDGYMHQEELSQRYFHTTEGLRWYKTGDLVVEQEDGNLHFKGRVDDQWQIRGQRIERLALEVQLKTLLKRTDIAVIPSPITTEGLVLGIAVVVSTKNELEIMAIRKSCQQHCVPPFIPTAYIPVEEFPLNTSGKIDYKTLHQLYQKVEIN